jgi:uncharacterized cupin superfamily protein
MDKLTLDTEQFRRIGMTHESDRSDLSSFNLSSTYVVLAENGDAIPIVVSDRFYENLEQKFGDFKGKRLISHYIFEKDWDSWEMHPAGEEFVCLLSGQVDFVLEQDGGEKLVSLNAPGAYVLVPRGIWHTAKVHRSSTVLFITPGEGTQCRPA